MVVPAHPAADLVLVEPDLAFGLFEAGLDRPATRGDLPQHEQRHPWWGVGQVQLELAAIGVASEQGGQLAADDAIADLAHPVLRELVGPWSLGTQANRERLPAFVRQPRCERRDGRGPTQVSA